MLTNIDLAGQQQRARRRAGQVPAPAPHRGGGRQHVGQAQQRGLRQARQDARHRRRHTGIRVTCVYARKHALTTGRRAKRSRVVFALASMTKVTRLQFHLHSSCTLAVASAVPLQCCTSASQKRTCGPDQGVGGAQRVVQVVQVRLGARAPGAGARSVRLRRRRRRAQQRRQHRLRSAGTRVSAVQFTLQNGRLPPGQAWHSSSDPTACCQV
jgi:hypothetical protein